MRWLPSTTSVGNTWFRNCEDSASECLCDPDGAFYVLADATRFGDDSMELARHILEATKVAVAPGIDFGSSAEGYIRFSYANSLDNLKEAVTRLSELEPL